MRGMVAALIRHYNTSIKNSFSDRDVAPPLLSLNDLDFGDAKAELDRQMVTATSEGRGRVVQQAALTAPELQQIRGSTLFLIDWGSLNSSELNMRGWYGGVWSAAWRGEQEPADLSMTDLEFIPAHLHPTKKDSWRWHCASHKTYAGGLNDKDPFAPVDIFRNDLNPQLCFHRFLEERAKRIRPGNDNKRVFLSATHSRSGGYLYNLGKQNVGVSTIRKWLPTICVQAGVPKRSNHGMRRTVITTLYTLKVPEAEIMKISRHKTLESLRKYMTCAPEALRESTTALQFAMAGAPATVSNANAKRDREEFVAEEAASFEASYDLVTSTQVTDAAAVKRVRVETSSPRPDNGSEEAVSSPPNALVLPDISNGKTQDISNNTSADMEIVEESCCLPGMMDETTKMMARMVEILHKKMFYR
jgi:hypothetical protein